MTADKQQRHSHRLNGNRSRKLAGRVEAQSAGDSAAPEQSPARLQMRLSLLPAHGKLAGFGGSAAPGIQPPEPAIPIWFAALLAALCLAKAQGGDRDVSWNCISGRAVYTNRGLEEETIEPLGVRLQGGHSVAVSWGPGETSYTVEIFRQLDCVA